MVVKLTALVSCSVKKLLFYKSIRYTWSSIHNPFIYISCKKVKLVNLQYITMKFNFSMTLQCHVSFTACAVDKSSLAILLLLSHLSSQPAVAGHTPLQLSHIHMCDKIEYDVDHPFWTEKRKKWAIGVIQSKLNKCKRSKFLLLSTSSFFFKASLKSFLLTSQVTTKSSIFQNRKSNPHPFFSCQVTSQKRWLEWTRGHNFEV